MQDSHNKRYQKPEISTSARMTVPSPAESNEREHLADIDLDDLLSEAAERVKQRRALLPCQIQSLVPGRSKGSSIPPATMPARQRPRTPTRPTRRTGPTLAVGVDAVARTRHPPPPPWSACTSLNAHHRKMDPLALRSRRSNDGCPVCRQTTGNAGCLSTCGTVTSQPCGPASRTSIESHRARRKPC